MNKTGALASPHPVAGATPIGLLAGWGRFPILFAEKARSLDIPVVCVGIRHEAAPELMPLVRRFYWSGLGKIGRTIRCFRKEGIRHVVMAGKIHVTAEDIHRLPRLPFDRALDRRADLLRDGAGYLIHPGL